MEHTEADSETEEEHLVNFVVNSLNDELAINLGEDVEVMTETLYEVLAGASVGGTSINHVCETTNDLPHANTVRGHLTEQFELDSVEAAGDTLLQRDALATFPDQPLEVCADLQLDPYDGDEDETEALYFSQAKPGTIAFHVYAMLCARVRNKRYTLANPPAMSSLSFLNSLTVLTSASRPSPWIADSTTVPVSDCCPRATPPMRCQSSNGVRRFKPSLTEARSARSSTISLTT
uniref:Transposase n=1 Tax=uncultured haloarchaeon TaxID=160804 RepID=A0A0K1YB40_9EURY|nr:transposase [uncultured haloarchaeon]